jgi:hypothetical protein
MGRRYHILVGTIKQRFLIVVRTKYMLTKDLGFWYLALCCRTDAATCAAKQPSQETRGFFYAHLKSWDGGQPRGDEAFLKQQEGFLLAAVWIVKFEAIPSLKF